MTPSAQSLLNEMARAGYNGRKAGEKLAYIAKEYNASRITRETAQTVAEPLIREINLKEREIARKYGKKPSITTFTYAMRALA